MDRMQLRRSFLRTLLVWGSMLSALPAFSQSFTDSGFFVETLAILPRFQPVGMTWAPDGRMFIWQDNGTVRILKNGALLPSPFLDIGDHVNTANDRGLLGLALDPDFDANGYIYLLYAFEPGGQPGDPGPKTTRLTRMQADLANPDRILPGSESILLGSLGTAPCSQYPAGSDCIGTDEDSHGGGTLRFAPDGKLFASIGDGASYRVPDPLSFRAQDLDRYEGKILRINPDGSAPGDNPFDDGTQSIRSKVYAYGLRNPYRFGLDSLGEPYIGDVGTNRFEEVNRGRGANFGWPCLEGDGPNWYRVNYPGFERCRTMDSNQVTKPVYAYGRTQGTSVIGGSFNTGNRYPDSLAGDFFFADYATGQIMRMKLDGLGHAASVQVFAGDLKGPVSVERGPDGYLYYIAYSVGGAAEIRRIGYANPPPIANASASPPYGRTPLVVAFSSAGSSDPGGNTLAYHWDFGDGSTSMEANPIHLYAPTEAGNFLAVLTVTDIQGKSAQARIEITLGSSPPTAAITRPAPGAVFHVGDTVFFEASGSDSDQVLPDQAFSWLVLLHHDTHVHPYAAATGPRGQLVVMDHGEGEYRYSIQLTVTDGVGLKTNRVVETAVILPPHAGVPGQGSLQVTATPPEASISISPSQAHAGRSIGHGSATWTGLPGTVWVEVSADGYQTACFTEEISEGISVQRRVELEPGRTPCLRGETPLDFLVAALPAGFKGMIAIGDTSGDGGQDLVLLGGDFLRLFQEVQKDNRLPKIHWEDLLRRLRLPEVAGMTLVDVDEDGDHDLIAGFKDGLVAVAYFSRCSGFGRFSAVLQGPSAAVYPAVADLDGDGIKDLLLNAGQLGLFAYRNIGSASAPVLAAAQDIPLPETGAYFQGPVMWDDFNADGAGDIAGFTEGRLRIYSGLPGAPQPILAKGFDAKIAGRIREFLESAMGGAVRR